jgi:CheY-like chemotaxis protein
MEENKKILVVEDDAFLRDIYTEILAKAGYTIDSADDGQKGLEKIQKGGWDLVLLDIIMPVMSGVDVMRKLHEEGDFTPRKYYKKLIFLTNLDNDQEIKEALKFSDGYLIKSQLTPGDVLNEVKVYLST